MAGEDVVGGGSTKDANCSMGRIAWFDALARRWVGYAETRSSPQQGCF